MLSVPLLRTRPSLRLRAPRDVVPGVPFEIAVLLDARESVEIEWCDVSLIGREFLASVTDVIPRMGARLSGPRVLPVGTTTLPCRLTLPEGAIRSKQGPGTRVSYAVSVHASVPWWPDARGEFALHVIGRPGEPVEGRGRVAVSRLEGPVEGAPYAELSVSTDVVELDGVIDARVSMRDVGDATVTLSLVAYETEGGVQRRTASWTLPASASASLAFRIPRDVTPTMSGRHFTLDYWLVAEARGAISSVVTASVAIRVVDPGGASTTSRMVAPHVGDTRLEELFTAVGAAEGATVEPGPVLVVRRGAVEARATRELGRDGTRLAVRVTYPPLHLDLHVYERSLLALAGDGRRVAREAGLGPRCVVKARDHEQASTMLERLASRLERARAIEMDDTSLRYDVPTSANDRQTVGRVIRDMSVLAETLALPVPLPSALAGATHAWGHLARELGGTLEGGRARVVAMNDDASVEVQTTFDVRGTPCGTRVATRPARELRLDAPIVLEDGALPAHVGIGPDARTAAERLAKLGRLRVDATEIVIIIDAPLGLALPVGRAKEIVDGSRRLAAALRPTSGPFR
jgi:hypothetical protein